MSYSMRVQVGSTIAEAEIDSKLGYAIGLRPKLWQDCAVLL